MALPASGPISLSQVNTELGKATNAPISLGDAAVRSLSGQPSGLVDMNSLHGKSAYPAAGTYLTQYCSGYSLVYRYANGSGGYYDTVVENNSPACGYVSGSFTFVGSYHQDGYLRGTFTPPTVLGHQLWTIENRYNDDNTVNTIDLYFSGNVSSGFFSYIRIQELGGPFYMPRIQYSSGVTLFSAVVGLNLTMGYSTYHVFLT